MALQVQQLLSCDWIKFSFLDLVDQGYAREQRIDPVGSEVDRRNFVPVSAVEIFGFYHVYPPALPAVSGLPERS